MTQIKELYMGKTLDDLEQHTIIPNVRNRNTKSLMETAHKLCQQADKIHLQGDEELAYVLYMKYFNLLSCIREKPDYSQYKNLLRQMLGGHAAQTDTMDKLEVLSNSLKRRYARLHDITAPPATPTSTCPSPNAKRLPCDYNDLSADEKFDLLKRADSSNKQRIPSEALSLISCEELFPRIQENSVLIMDCRSSTDYQCSHLSYTWSFNVPEEHIVAGMSAGRLRETLDNNGKVMWSARSVKDWIVLMDWNCMDAKPAMNTPIAILQDILKYWDPDVSYRSPIQILKGGYEYFIIMYPTWCTNPSVQSPKGSDIQVDPLDDIEYPSIHDIMMKEDIESLWKENTLRGESIENASGSHYIKPPSVDRTSKVAALKTYEQLKHKSIAELIKEQEELMERAKENDAQLEQATKKWQAISQNNNNTENNNLSSSNQMLLYDILQLESTAKDYKNESNRLREELEKYKRLELKQQEHSVTETTNKIESEFRELEKLSEQHERERQQREQQLALARENKRHLKPPEIEDEEISQPKIPQFDRSIKPPMSATCAEMPVQIMNFHVDRRRDFSPVPGSMGLGLTGLKNLGNTCYMNSIIQCLSNTPQLTEYCLSDKYKNYISRSNKTQGHIIEEVAALIKVMWNGNFKCVASKDLRYTIGQYQQMFRGIEQHDSHEFLTILMDWLHSDLQTLPVPKRTSDNITASELAWMQFTNSRESLILRLFYGQIKSTIKCAECNKESATYESFSNLSLELPASAAHLSQCMDMYFSGELIHGWNCPNCKRKRNAVKKLDISKLPPVLVIHFKRFFADGVGSIGNSYRKKQDYVRFPLENLHMTPHISKSEMRTGTPKTYQLYSVSNHYGSIESGHYTAFCKNSSNGRWFKFDDQIVSPIDKLNVVSSAAYILFYTWLPPVQ